MLISSLIAFFFPFFSSPSPSPLPVIPWHEAKIFQIMTESDAQVSAIALDYLQTLTNQGLITHRQGLWIQSDWAILADNQGEIPASAASLTKIATTIAAIQTWGLNHRFITSIYSTGKINNGVLEGDLVIKAGGDSLFVWEEAINLANRLQNMGIREVKGDLLIVGNWQMNYQEDKIKSGELFKQALNSNNWSYAIEKQYEGLKNDLFRPKIIIQGQVKSAKKIEDNWQLLLNHQSLTLREIIRLMNVYSNNKIAESLAQQIGGSEKITEIAAEIAQVNPKEILLINGSGLGVDNRISPRAAARMLMGLNTLLENTDTNLGDLFPVAGVDIVGTIEDRSIPNGIIVKTGTLSVVSALAGVIATEERGNVYFAIINYGSDLNRLRRQQDILLQNLQQHWTLDNTFFQPRQDIDIKFGLRNQN